MEDVETSTSISFHDVDYVITVSVKHQQLYIQIENDGVTNTLKAQCWIGQFSSSYIQDMTRKTGNFKRFPVFVNMLLSAVERRSEAVFVDLLTSADLEEYRQRKLCNRTSPTLLSVAESSYSESMASSKSKQYLILTYTVAFDRVHYPLPLSIVDSPNSEILERTIRRLRRQLQKAPDAPTQSQIQALSETVSRLTNENQSLKASATEKHHLDRHSMDKKFQELQKELEKAREERDVFQKLYTQLEERSQREIEQIKSDIMVLRERQPIQSDSEYKTKYQSTQTILDEKTLEIETLQRESRSSKTRIQLLEEKNRQLMRQISGVSAQTYKHLNPRPRSRTSAYLQERLYHKESDSSDNSESVSSRSKRFPRFDPTAYHQERQRRMQARSSSIRRKINAISSSSECSNDSCDSRLSTRRSISSQQKESVNRLAAPKSQSALPPRSRSVERTRRPSAMSSTPPKRTTPPVSKNMPRPARTRSISPKPERVSPRPSEHSKPVSSTESTVSACSKKTLLSKLDSSMDSFSDIDDRLSALQQFLRDAKKRSTQAPMAA